MPKLTIGQRVALRLAAAAALGVGLDVKILDRADSNNFGYMYKIETLNGSRFFEYSSIHWNVVWVREPDLTAI